MCLFPWVFLKHAIFVESYLRSQRTTLLSFGFVILLVHLNSLNEQKRCKVAQNNGKSIRMNCQSNFRNEQLLKLLNLFFYTEREIARNEFLDIGSLGTNQEEYFFGFHRNLALGHDRFSKFIEN
jgi:hypothetical protein